MPRSRDVAVAPVASPWRPAEEGLAFSCSGKLHNRPGLWHCREPHGREKVSPSARIYRFGSFELDLAAYQLRRDGRPVRLERRPMDLLILLVERRGQLVARTEIVDVLWGKDVFVEVDTAVHTAVRKIRQALRDSPDNPAFIETVPAKGYRFAASVDVVVSPGAPAPRPAEAGLSASDRTPVEPLTYSWRRYMSNSATRLSRWKR